MSDENKCWVTLREVIEVPAGTIGIVQPEQGMCGYFARFIADGKSNEWYVDTMLANPEDFALIQPPPKPEKAPEGWELTGRLLHQPTEPHMWVEPKLLPDGSGLAVYDLKHRTAVLGLFDGWRWELRPSNSSTLERDLQAKIDAGGDVMENWVRAMIETQSERLRMARGDV